MNISNNSDPAEENNENYSDDGGYEPCSNSVNVMVGPYIHSIICILGLVGNSLVILTYALYKRTKSMTDVYLLNVAIADLLFVLALPFIVYNELYSWPMGQVACKLLRGSYSVNLYSGMLMLTVAYLHCCLNPLLYAFIGVKFRSHFSRIFQNLCCVGKRYIAPRRSSRATSDIGMSTFRHSVNVTAENSSSLIM
ncbi:C-C chemokine receptor type 6-like [Poecilia reticulata]|uniref:C-C chemokine receptor type 6-like n=1 Tax=Poecilia reticulata TaxID=8081 RepID=UPI0007EA0496|nr:PREDICTED: C-C chemokine receptor type 6-like [Poecilia reticulata]